MVFTLRSIMQDYVSATGSLIWTNSVFNYFFQLQVLWSKNCFFTCEGKTPQVSSPKVLRETYCIKNMTIFKDRNSHHIIFKYKYFNIPFFSGKDAALLCRWWELRRKKTFITAAKFWSTSFLLLFYIMFKTFLRNLGITHLSMVSGYMKNRIIYKIG